MFEEMPEKPASFSIAQVPPTLLFAMLMQMAGVLIWASHLEARVQGMEKVSESSVVLGEKFARLEERLESLKYEITAMRQQIQMLDEHWREPPSAPKEAAAP